MSLIIRTWGCQNQACLATFDSSARAPACPKCGCVRVGWVPRAVNIGKTAPGADRELRTLADMYGLSDLNSAREGQQAKKVSLPAAGGGGVVNFQGFSAHIDPSQGAQCVPTVNRIEHKVRPGVGEKLTGQLGLGPIAANTQVTASHKRSS